MLPYIVTHWLWINHYCSWHSPLTATLCSPSAKLNCLGRQMWMMYLKYKTIVWTDTEIQHFQSSAVTDSPGVDTRWDLRYLFFIFLAVLLKFTARFSLDGRSFPQESPTYLKTENGPLQASLPTTKSRYFIGIKDGSILDNYDDVRCM